MTHPPDDPSMEQPVSAGEQLPIGWGDPDDPDVQLGKVLDDLEQNREEPVQRGELVQVLRTIKVQHSGPLPPPALLEEYNAVIPNGADRIMAMAEREQAHRHEMEQRDQNLAEQAEEHEFRITQRGQAFGLGICLAVIVAAVALAIAGHPKVAAVLVGLDLVSLAAVFVIGRILPGRGKSEDTADEPDDLPEITPDD